MRLVFTSYNSSPEFTCPRAWLKRIAFYTGILDKLSETHSVTAVEHISYTGEFWQNGVRYLFWPLKKKVTRFPFHKHRMMKKLAPDVVFINGFIFPWQIIQLRLQLGKTTKIIVLHRAEKPFKGYKAVLQKMADRFVSGYFFSSLEQCSSWISGGIIPDQTKFHEILQSSSIFSSGNKPPSLDLPRKISYNFLWVGRLDENKDPVTVMKAFIGFLEFAPRAQLKMIYQGGDLFQDVELLKNSSEKARNAIRLVGSVQHIDLKNYLGEADFLLSGSHYEGSGISVIEAMSCGCIPILTNIPSFRKMTNGGQLGFLYEVGDNAGLLNIL
ncbi:MAG: glycosyltransferase family 1 protein, partial [Chitinophagaceae bacterium]